MMMMMMMSLGTENAVGPSVLVAPPHGVSGPLASSAGRALQHLPDELLWAMARGLSTHADDLAPGVLFRGHSSGGCAVGITLRELAPDAFDFGWLQFWLRQRWRRGIERDVARRFPHLNHLQRHFDAAVAELEEEGCDPQPAKAVGLWLAASAEAELRARRSDIAEKGSLLTRPACRAHRRADGPVRARVPEAERTEHSPVRR
jgi:hypothetical protein